MPEEKKKNREEDGENITSSMYNLIDDLWHCQRQRIDPNLLYFGTETADACGSII